MYKEKLIPIIKYLGIIEDEVMVEFDFGGKIVFNSIEWRKEKNTIILHKIEDEYDFEYNYDDMSPELQKDIYYALLRIAY